MTKCGGCEIWPAEIRLCFFAIRALAVTSIDKPHRRQTRYAWLNLFEPIVRVIGDRTGGQLSLIRNSCCMRLTTLAKA
jgi:hypothetical protein